MRKDLYLFLALLAFALVCYRAILRTFFLSDDFGFISDLGIEGGYSGENRSFLRPITHLTFKLDYAISGLTPLGYHLTNVFFHSLAAFAVYLLARHFFERLRPDDASTPAFLSAALFVALPSHSEAVTWISGRTDVIATALGLFATYHFLTLLSVRSIARASLALSLLIGALLAKESAIVLPFIWCALYTHDRWQRRRSPPAHSTFLLFASFGLLAAYFALRKILVGEFIGGYGTAFHIRIFEMSSLDQILEFVLRTFTPPLSPSFLQQIDEDPSRSTWKLSGILFTGLLVLFWMLRKRLTRSDRAWILLLAACYSMALVPVITLGVHLFDTQGERFLYLPSAFACMFFVHGSTVLISRPRLRTYVMAGLIVIAALVLQSVNERWIVASRISREIVAEASGVDFRATDILNLPDNYRGAYIFRNGFLKAMRGLSGNTGYSRDVHRTACIHDMESMDERYEVSLKEREVTFRLPVGRSCILTRDDWLYGRTTDHVMYATTNVDATYPDFASLLVFRIDGDQPMLRRVHWEAPDAPRPATHESP